MKPDLPPLVLRWLGHQPYQPAWQRMQTFTDARGPLHADEIWFLEHPPVFTQGQAGRAEHVLAAGDIPVVQVDRGGQVTYHGPGQLVAYLLLDLGRLGMGVRDLVSLIEGALVGLLADQQIVAEARRDAPGVYVDGAKIASLGLRVRRGCSYHGLSFNIDMDLSPFNRINPCGFRGLPMTQLVDLGVEMGLREVADLLGARLQLALGYTLSEAKEGFDD